MKLRNVFFLAAAVLLLATAALSAEKVTARTETVSIPTFEIDRGSPEPAIFEEDRHGAYPLSMLNVGSRSATPVDRQYTMAIVENELVRVDVLPAVGGRVWRFIDKQADRNLLWTNDAVKPVNVGRRSGWIAGGIEFPYPAGNHGGDTIDPYRWAIRENEDGSATITVMSFDHFYRFWGSYDITVAPGEARLAITARLYNPTLVRNRYQFWINTAVEATDDMQYLLPVDWVSGHGTGRVHPWPAWEQDGTDRSFWKNQREALGVFGWNADFVGAYYHTKDYGLLRYSSHTKTEGIKMWTWGTNSHWTTEYSIANGPYGEIQGGRWPTQEMYGWLEPHQMDTWTEYWYPVRGLGGVDAASKDAAASMKIIEAQDGSQTAEIRVFAVRPIKGRDSYCLNGEEVASSEFVLPAGEVSTCVLNLRPSYPKDVVPLSPGPKPEDVLSLSLKDEQGFELLSYERTIVKKPAPRPELPPSVRLEGEGPEFVALRSALALELEQGNPHGSRRKSEEVSVQYPGFAAGWKALGILAYKQADLPKAVEALGKALSLQPEDPEAQYYLALAKLYSGAADAAESLGKVAGDVQFSHAAAFVSGLELLKSGKYSEAAAALTKASQGWSLDPVMWDYLAVARRLSGNRDAAQEAIAAALSAEPLDPFAAVEQLVASDTLTVEGIARALGTDDDLYIEVALFYDAVGQNRTALEVAQAGSDKASSSLYYCHLAHLASRADEAQLASEYAAKIDEMGAPYVFPHRREDLAVLKAASAAGANGAFMDSYAGTLLWWLGRQEDALSQWNAVVQRQAVPGLRRRIADAWFGGKVQESYDFVVDMYAAALKEDPSDVVVYSRLDDLYIATNDYRARETLLTDARERFPEEDEIALRAAILLTERRKPAEAAAILESHQFHRAHELGRLMRLGSMAITDTYRALAEEARRNGQNDKALEHLDTASRARETVRQWFD